MRVWFYNKAQKWYTENDCKKALVAEKNYRRIDMIAELISVGNELLMGKVVNTNAAFLAEQCTALGLSCQYQTTVGDNADRLKDLVKLAMGRADIVILAGGMGLTKDDITKEACADLLGRKLATDAATEERIKEYYKKIGKKPSDNAWKQAKVPKDAIVLQNSIGTAPGVILEEDKTTMILLPGRPEELIPMFRDGVMPYLASRQIAAMESQTVKIVGVTEGEVAQAIDDLMDEEQNPMIAAYAKTGEIHLVVTARAEDEKKAKKLLKPVIKELKMRFNEHIYSTEPDVTLEQSLVELLITNNLTVSTVESCTGGLLAGRIINVPGVSEVFKMGHITYSNKAKRKIIGVKRSTLDKYGAVSEPVAREMAKGGIAMAKTDVSVAVTGVAGPTGGTEDKPVGLVYIGCCVKGKTTVREYRFSGDRDKVRRYAVAAALVLMRECVLEYVSEMTFGKKK